MKKKFTLVIGAALAAIFAVGLTGCGWEPPIDGNFPYDVAVQQGYTGTESSWLAQNDEGSTVYRRMYLEAKAGGYAGSYVEFLKTVGISEDDTPYLQQALGCAVSIQCSFNGSSSGAAGSGVILSYNETSGDMTIVTNYHVVYSATRGVAAEIFVWLYGTPTNTNSLIAEYVGGALEYDIAVLSVKGSGVVTEGSENGEPKTHTNLSVIQKNSPCAAVLADSDDVTVGDAVYAIGNPLAEGISVSHGIISKDAEDIDLIGADDKTAIDLLSLRIDVPVNHGNSGGGLFTRSGELVGIVNARNEEDGAVGVGYAIPINRALAVAQNIVDNGGKLKNLKAGITVYVQDSKNVFSEETGKRYIEDKIVVQKIELGSPFYMAGGLQIGDTLVHARLLRGGALKAEKDLTRIFYLEDILLQARQGDMLELTVSREGETVVSTKELA